MQMRIDPFLIGYFWHYTIICLLFSKYCNINERPNFWGNTYILRLIFKALFDFKIFIDEWTYYNIVMSVF